MSEMDLTKDKCERIMRYVLLALTFAALLISGIACSTPILKLIPLFNSLFIMMLQAKANRYAYILGGLNSILYAVIYVYAGIYASAASAFFFSFPVQILTFWFWNKNSYEKSTRFRTEFTSRPWVIYLIVSSAQVIRRKSLPLILSAAILFFNQGLDNAKN